MGGMYSYYNNIKDFTKVGGASPYETWGKSNTQHKGKCKYIALNPKE